MHVMPSHVHLDVPEREPPRIKTGRGLVLEHLGQAVQYPKLCNFKFGPCCHLSVLLDVSWRPCKTSRAIQTSDTGRPGNLKSSSYTPNASGSLRLSVPRTLSERE